MPLLEQQSFDYTSFDDVLSEVRDVCILDLARFTLRLPQSYEECLMSEPPGVYLYGALEPVLRFTPSEAYYSASQFRNIGAMPDIVSFSTFIECKEPVVNHLGKVIFHRPYFMRENFRPTCSHHYSAVHLCFIAVWDAMRALHRATYPTTNVNQLRLNPNIFVIPECLERFDEANQPGIAQLLEQVYGFIGRDVFSLYHLKFKNTTLYLEKGNDFRVVEYYRNIFDKGDKDDELFSTYR